MHTRPESGGNNGFLIGLVTGGVIGAGLAIVFAIFELNLPVF